MHVELESAPGSVHDVLGLERQRFVARADRDRSRLQTERCYARLSTGVVDVVGRHVEHRRAGGLEPECLGRESPVVVTVQDAQDAIGRDRRMKIEKPPYRGRVAGLGLPVEQPILVRATDHIPEMADFIAQLQQRGYAYRTDDGSYYFRIAKFPEYGKLSKKDFAGMEDGARVDVKMTLTSQACPLSGQISAQVQRKLLELSGVGEANVEVVFDPPWSFARISPDGKKTLGLP